jgi:hypothetical protein
MVIDLTATFAPAESPMAGMASPYGPRLSGAALIDP